MKNPYKAMEKHIMRQEGIKPEPVVEQKQESESFRDQEIRIENPQRLFFIVALMIVGLIMVYLLYKTKQYHDLALHFKELYLQCKPANGLFFVE